MSKYQVDRPVQFSGSEEERAANLASHSFTWSDPDTRCTFCDCKPWHQAASYPCGDEPPREVIVTDDYDTFVSSHYDQAVRFLAYKEAFNNGK
jgi:hypothetical protein